MKLCHRRPYGAALTRRGQTRSRYHAATTGMAHIAAPSTWLLSCGELTQNAVANAAKIAVKTTMTAAMNHTFQRGSRASAKVATCSEPKVSIRSASVRRVTTLTPHERRVSKGLHLWHRFVTVRASFRRLPVRRTPYHRPMAVSAPRRRRRSRPGRRLLAHDRELGVRFVAGADEAGRGSLAGPLVVAAVCLDMDLLRGRRCAALGMLD